MPTKDITPYPKVVIIERTDGSWFYDEYTAKTELSIIKFHAKAEGIDYLEVVDNQFDGIFLYGENQQTINLVRFSRETFWRGTSRGVHVGKYTLQSVISKMLNRSIFNHHSIS